MSLLAELKFRNVIRLELGQWTDWSGRSSPRLNR
jgi:hypothetical protein